MLKKLIFATTLLAGYLQPINAQQTAVYRDSESHYKRGMEFYIQGLYGKAADEFEFVTNNRNTAEQTPVAEFYKESRLYHGLAGLRLDRPDAEKELLTFIREFDPGNIANKAKMEVAGYYYDQQNYQKAIQFYDLVETSSMSNDNIAEIKFKKAYSYFVTKNFTQARKEFALIKDIQNANYYPSNYYHGISCFFLKDNNGALASFQKVTKSKQYSRVVPYYICQIYFEQKEYDTLIEYGEPLMTDNALKNRLEIGQLVGQAYFEKGNYKKALPLMEAYINGTQKVSKENLYQLGVTQMKSDNCSAAVQNFEQLSGLKEELAQSAFFNMGNCYLKVNDKASARSSYYSASKMDYNKEIKEEANFLYGKLSAELNYDKDAIEVLRNIDEKSKHYNESQTLLGMVFINTKDYDNALEIIRKIPNKTPKLRESYQKVAFYRAVQLYNDNRYDESDKLFKESQDTPYDDALVAQAHFWLAENMARSNKTADAIKEYNKFLTKADASMELPDNCSRYMGYYGLGYAYLKKDDYANASDNFNKCVEGIQKAKYNIKDLYVINQVYPDATVRSGDCYLMQNRYEKALAFYNSVLTNHFKNEDYALFQKANILGLQGKASEKIILLEDLSSKYPTSKVSDDALYQLGTTYNNLGKSDKALDNFKKIVNNKKDSEYYNRSLLNLGLIYFNQGQNETSLNYYKKVFENNPDANESKSALNGIQEVYSEMGNPDGYLSFLETTTGGKVSDTEKDTITFRSAEKPYLDGQYEKAIASLSNYINKFPKGLNQIKARFERAESYFELKRYEDALSDYSSILQRGKSNYAEVSSYKAAEICFKSTKNYSEAFSYYMQLENFATTEAARYQGVLGAMRSAWLAGKYEKVDSWADKVTRSTEANTSEKAEGYFYLGKNALNAKRVDEARLALGESYKLDGDSERGAEAAYLLAYIYYAKKDLATSEKKCLENGDNLGSYPYWLSKSYILLADIYTDQNKTRAAKTTLQSIIDNYDGDNQKEIVDEATAKLDKLNGKTAPSTKIKEENKDGLLEMEKGN